ncbi:hypothetical protein NEOLEDRAFT_1077757 [Neolentinus lepideus HHB14362 ss-1]|uniref:Uncharacterized protein n=1 Tax=Neolentinus lepideus HHB14362 ss-1 TaxID=1314782 RepID=A0A165NCD1_9AGAM|nr:hypothetical protein NEOLEDRAFT_1077757 [Neolentinus lepideus HHB14362 ss-1]
MKEKAGLNEPVDNPFVPPSGCPINRLPPELLSYIFTLGTRMQVEIDTADEDEQDYIDSESDFSDSDTDSAIPFQVLVSHVCKQWREVALLTPTLWTFIDFMEGPPYEKSRALVERSKGAPLEISIDCHGHAHGDEEVPEEDDELLSEDDYKPMTLDDLSTVLSLIIPHVERWKSFELMVHDYKFMHKALIELSKCPAAPILELFQLYHYDDWDIEDDDHFIFQPQQFKTAFVPFQGHAPRLSSVALWGVHVAWPGSVFLSGLRDLELAYHTHDVRPSYAEFSRMLRSSPRLEILALSASGPAGQPPDWLNEDGTTDTIELPALTDLVLAFNTTPYVCGLMKVFSVPKLTNLTLDFDVADGDQTDFIMQISKPRSEETKALLNNLAQLKIGGLACDRPVLNDLLAGLTNLRSLNINVEHMDENFFEKLGRPVSANEENSRHSPSDSMVTSSTSMYCPLLESITTTGVDGTHMRTFLQARAKAGKPIKRVCMNEDDYVNEVDEEWITSNVETFELFEGSDDDDIDDVSVIEIDDNLDDEDFYVEA